MNFNNMLTSEALGNENIGFSCIFLHYSFFQQNFYNSYFKGGERKREEK